MMNLQILLISFLVIKANLALEDEMCPDIEKKPESKCDTITRKPICWSPGVDDVDCPTGNPDKPFGLCCYDGCQNSCLATTNCKNDCKNITTNVTTKVPVEVCTSELLKECRNITTQVINMINPN